MLRASLTLLWYASLLAQADGLCAHLAVANPHAGGWLFVAQSQLVQIQDASFCKLARVFLWCFVCRREAVREFTCARMHSGVYSADLHHVDKGVHVCAWLSAFP